MSTTDALSARRSEPDCPCQRSRSILDSALDAIISTDAQGRITEFNPAAVTMFGYAASEAIGRPYCDLLIPEQQRELHRRGLAAHLATGQGPIVGRRIEVEALHRDGRLFPVEMAIFAIASLEPAFTAFIRDISERRQVEEALLKAKLQAEEASLAKSQFLASMSHELRTPLNGVIGMTELLMSTDLDERQLPFVRACQNSGRTLLRLINDVLDISKIEAGKLDLESHDFDLEQLVRETTDMVWMRTHDKGLALICEFDRQARQIYSGDSTRLRQILVNLLANAEKFTDRGEIVLSVQVVEHLESTATLRFSVRDSGIGIPPDRVHRLFQLFSQVDSSTTRKYGGTGLGLAICKHLVDAMGGSIGVESQVGEGSTFWFTLTLPVVEGCELQAPQDELLLKDCRVLIVDSNRTSRTILEKQTRSWGLLPEVADSARQATQFFVRASQSGKPFGLVLCDERLSDDTADGLAEALAAFGDLPPLILLGANSKDAAAKGPHAAGIQQQLAKPVLSTQLYTAIHSLLQPQGRHDSPETTQQSAGKASETLAPSFKGELLIAEDNAVNTLYVTSLLNQAGYVTQTAGNGLQAVLAVRTHQFSLVLMDCQMPELDGYEATRCIRGLEAKGRLAGHVPIIALTANAVKGDAERCLEAGMDAYLSKPFEPQQLLRLVEKLARPVEIDESHGDFSEDGSRTPIAGSNELEDSTAVNHRRGASRSQNDNPKPLPQGSSGSMARSEFHDNTIAMHSSQPLSFSEEPPIDAEALLNRCMGDAEFAESLLMELKSTGSDHIDQIARYVESGDALETADAAHALKGAAAVLSAEPVRRLAAEIEKTGRAGSLDGIEATLNALRKEMDRCLRFIPVVIETARNAQPSDVAAGSRS